MRPGPGGKDFAHGVGLSLLMPVQLVVAGLDVGRFHWSDHLPPAVQVAALPGDGRRDGGPDLGGGGQSLLLLGDPHPDRTRTPRDHQRPLSLPAAPRLRGGPVPLVGGGLVLGSMAGRADRTAHGHADPAAHRSRRTASSWNNSTGYADYARKVRYRLSRACGRSRPTRPTPSRGLFDADHATRSHGPRRVGQRRVLPRLGRFAGPRPRGDAPPRRPHHRGPARLPGGAARRGARQPADRPAADPSKR